MSSRAVSGGCHCRRVRFEVDVPERPGLVECNCSICAMTGFLHLIVPEKDFRLLQGAEELVEYRFHTGAARHLFCRQCGIKSFYVPRSHPEGVSVNARCLDESLLEHARVQPFDGQNWEEHAASLDPIVGD